MNVLSAAGQAVFAVGALVWAGRGVAARASELGMELAAARLSRQERVRVLRKSFDDAQTVSDRLVATSLTRLHARLDALLPLPSAAELRASPDRAARIALWTALLERVFARAAVASVAQCLAFLAARVQISAVAGQAQGLSEEIGQADSLRAAFMARFVQLRGDHEHVLNAGLGALADAALAAARTALDGWTLSRPMRYGDVVQVLMGTRSALLAASLLQPEGGLAGLVAPLASESPGSDNVGELLLFYTRRAVSTREFGDVLDGCLALRFAAVNRCVLALFPSAAGGSVDGSGDGVLPPKLMPVLAAAIAENVTSPVATVAALQEMGNTTLVDRFMFNIFISGSSSPSSTSL